MPRDEITKPSRQTQPLNGEQAHQQQGSHSGITPQPLEAHADAGIGGATHQQVQAAATSAPLAIPGAAAVTLQTLPGLCDASHCASEGAKSNQEYTLATQQLLQALEAEHTAAVSSGMSLEAGRFLVEVRSLQLAATFWNSHAQHCAQQTHLAVRPCSDHQHHQQQDITLQKPSAAGEAAQSVSLADAHRLDTCRSADELGEETWRLLRASSPIDAVVSFLLGPVMALRAGSNLQSGYASDALAFLAQALQAGTDPSSCRSALHRLGSGPAPSHFLTL